MNLQSILKEVNDNYSTRVYGTRNELNNLMHQLDEYTNILSYGLIENNSGLFVEIVKLEEEKN